ncbi:MAG TPA: SUMF1/EgtB/PvdO family nonheme iron enzyme [Polyangiaceae bacterium]
MSAHSYTPPLPLPSRLFVARHLDDKVRLDGDPATTKDRSAQLTWRRHASSPKGCIDWYSAFLFCVWDGGRLPTESEWEYAAVGGANESLYAWGDEPVLTGLKDGGEAFALSECLGSNGATSASAEAEAGPTTRLS